MSTGPIVTYVIAREGSGVPSDGLLESCGRPETEGPVYVCRSVPEGIAPGDVPGVPQRGAGWQVEDVWVASVGWFETALSRDVPRALTERLIVRVPLPVAPVDEATLLLARLSFPKLRLAVRLDSPSPEDVFQYFNYLALPWLAVPSPTLSAEAWLAALARMLKLWLFDARTRTPMEPIMTVFGLLIGRRAGRESYEWRYRVIDDTGAELSAPARWTPFVHTALCAREVELLAAEHLKTAEADLTNEVMRLLAAINLEQLQPLIRVPQARMAGVS